jgi:hypothetical protein
MVIGGIFFGCLALIVEMGLYHRYEFWPRNVFLFYLRLITFSTLFIALSFTVSSFGSNALDTLIEGKGVLVAVHLLLIIPFAIAFYLTMIIPFGTVVGLVNGLLLRSRS